MAQVQHIQLKAHKGLKGATLPNLGKINVICGPNNSGKTTVLECIVNKKLHSRGISLDENATDRVAANSGANINWRSPDLALHFEKIVSSVLKDRDVAFEDEAEKLEAIIAQAWHSNLSGYSIPNSNFRHCFNSEFPAAPTVVLVPAKRRLESSKEVQANDQI